MKLVLSLKNKENSSYYTHLDKEDLLVWVKLKTSSTQGGRVKLKEALTQLDTFEKGSTIFVNRDKGGDIYENTEVIVCSLAEFEEKNASDLGYSYLLEVFLAKDVLAGWSYMRQGKLPNDNEKCRAVIYYSENDTYLDPEQDDF